MKKTLLSILMLTLAFCGFAQQDTIAKKIDSAVTKLNTPASDTAVKKAVSKSKSYFLGSLSYLTNSVYNGRKDSVATPYITPMIGYYNKSGFYINAALSYLARAGSGRVDLFNIEAGYDFYIGDFDGEVSASKSFYNSASTNVQASITGSVYFNGAYDLVYIKPTFEAGVIFGTNPDYVFNFGLEHTFYQLKDKLRITPTFSAYGSTQNYYGAYYDKRKMKTKKKTDVTYEVTAGVEDASKYKMLNYEFSLPIRYTVKKKITFSIVPFYAIPVNPSIVKVELKPVNGGNTITRSSAEVISNSFYCYFGLSYKF